MERIFLVSNNLETTEINDYEIKTNEVNHQNTNSADEDDHKMQLENVTNLLNYLTATTINISRNFSRNIRSAN